MARAKKSSSKSSKGAPKAKNQITIDVDSALVLSPPLGRSPSNTNPPYEVTALKDYPDSLRHIPEFFAKCFLHQAYYGPLQGKSDLARIYICNECEKTFVIAANVNDDRRDQRLRHVTNNHLWAERFVEFCQERYGVMAENPMAEAAKRFGLTPTGDPRKDQAAIMFVFCARTGTPFSLVDSDDFRCISKTTVNLSSKSVLDAGESLADQVRAAISKDLPDKFAVMFDGWSAQHATFIGMYAVYPAGGHVVYRFLGIRPMLPKPAKPDAIDSSVNVVVGNTSSISILSTFRQFFTSTTSGNSDATAIVEQTRPINTSSKSSRRSSSRIKGKRSDSRLDSQLNSGQSSGIQSVATGDGLHDDAQEQIP
jgi:hypothetical protein